MSIIELFKNILVGAGACRLCIELLNEEQKQVMFGHRGVRFPSSLSFIIIYIFTFSTHYRNNNPRFPLPKYNYQFNSLDILP